MQDLPLRLLAYSYAAFAVAYLMGSLSFAVIISRGMGLADPRSYGSGNPGATNVLRSGNKVAAVLTLLLDALKGWLPVFLMEQYGALVKFQDTTLAFVGLAAFVGHLFPVLGLAALLTWGFVAAVFRYSSLASIITAVMAPFYLMLFFDRPYPALATVIMSLLLIWRHIPNIVKLVRGQESRLGEKADQRKQPERRRRRRQHRLHDDVLVNERRGGRGAVKASSREAAASNSQSQQP
jgi:glycerol-3-phosphate acyltransferase PlsY